MFPRVFSNSRSKKHRKYQCFWRVGSPKPRYLRCFLPPVANSTVFTVFFGQHLAKTLVFTEVSPCNKMGFLDPKRTKNASSNFILFFPTPNPQKRENPSRLKDCSGGSAAPARPRVAKANRASRPCGRATPPAEGR